MQKQQHVATVIVKEISAQCLTTYELYNKKTVKRREEKREEKRREEKRREEKRREEKRREDTGI
jgi:hypothetical protein